jgi:DNA-binding response OmpR family regulator
MVAHSRVVMLAKVNALVAMQIQDDLEEAGFRVAGPFATCEAASKWMEQHTPDLAIIAPTLADGSCEELARKLRSRSVPMVVSSGHDLAIEFSEEHGAILVEAPASSNTLLKAVVKALGSR